MWDCPQASLWAVCSSPSMKISHSKYAKPSLRRPQKTIQYLRPQKQLPLLSNCLLLCDTQQFILLALTLTIFMLGSGR